jgi:hypothetical protein
VQAPPHLRRRRRREDLVGGCTPTGAFLYLPGLRYFCADTPAFADEVNAHTQGLVSAVEQKVGRLGESAMSCGDNNVAPTLKLIR